MDYQRGEREKGIAMRTNKAVAPVLEAIEKYGKEPKKLARELKRLIREGQKSGDLLLVGAAYCRLAEACYDLDDQDGILSNALKAIALRDGGPAYVKINF